MKNYKKYSVKHENVHKFQIEAPFSSHCPRLNMESEISATLDTKLLVYANIFVATSKSSTLRGHCTSLARRTIIIIIRTISERRRQSAAVCGLQKSTQNPSHRSPNRGKSAARASPEIKS